MKDKIDYSEFVALCRGERKIQLTDEEKEKVRNSRKIFEDILRKNPKTLYYGINTGVGALLQKRIPKNRIKEFQKNLIMSHACGVGPFLERKIVKGMMLHMILNLKKGYSGIRLEILETLIAMFNHDVTPAVPEKGSLGASGDLIPQAHIALALIGRGWVRLGDYPTLFPTAKHGLHEYNGLGEHIGATSASPELEIGEAIALLNGTSFMTSLLAFLVYQSNILIEAADKAAALTIDVLGCNTQSFEDEIQRLRPHLGQIITAYKIGNIFKKRKPRVSSFLQDAYSLRCVPQVHGAFREVLYKAEEVVDIEINSFCGNPVISTKGGKPEIIQGSGNFHGQILAQTADNLSIALATLGNISERRIEKLLNSKDSFLPQFLAKEQGLDTGLMIAQYTAAALVSENKTLAHPASVDSIPVSAGQEDFVSMGAWAVRKAREICKNTEYILAIEILCASRALRLKKNASCPGEDKTISEDIERIRNIIHDGKFPEE